MMSNTMPSRINASSTTKATASPAPSSAWSEAKLSLWVDVLPVTEDRGELGFDASVDGERELLLLTAPEKSNRKALPWALAESSIWIRK